MKRRFVIVIDNASANEADAVTELLRDSGYGWWHWLKDLWLLVASKDKPSPSPLLERIVSLTSPKQVFITEVSVTDWMAFLPEKGRKWLDRNWNEDSFNDQPK